MSEYLRLRQICLVAGELEPAVEKICRVFGVEVCERSPGVARHGLVNAVMPFGSTFMEVVAPMPGKAPADTTAGRYLQRIGGDGGYMVILDSDDALRWRAHLEAVNVRVAQKLEYPTYKASQMHPKDVGGTLMSIGHDTGGDDLWGDWHAARKDWKKFVHIERVTAIDGVEMQSDDPQRLAKRWGEVLVRPANTDATGLHLYLDNARVHFVEDTNGRGETMSALTIQVADKRAILAAAADCGLRTEGDSLYLCGLRWDLQG